MLDENIKKANLMLIIDHNKYASVFAYAEAQKAPPTFEELKDKVIKHFLRERSMYQTKQSGEIAFKVDRVRQSHVQERAHSKEAGPAEYVALVHAIQEVN